MDTSGNKSTGVSKTLTMTLSQLDELKITLTPLTTEVTRENVEIRVNAVSSSKISKIYYASGIKTSIDSVIADGNDITSTASFIASENGIYTVVALDYDGRRDFSCITINNIDKIGPHASENFAAYNDYTKKTLTLTWIVQDSDVDHYLVSCTKEGAVLESAQKITDATYKISCADAGEKDVLD